MVTTIKITCDGVFIQTNSYRIRTTTRNSSSSSTTATTTAAITTSPSSSSQSSLIDRNNNNHFFCGENPVFISTKSTTVSSPASLPIILSPSSRIETKNIDIKSFKKSNSDKLTKREYSSEQNIYNEGDKNNGRTVRRRNTFKNYLIDCKENLVRRLSSSALNGQYFVVFLFLFFSSFVLLLYEIQKKSNFTNCNIAEVMRTQHIYASFFFSFYKSWTQHTRSFAFYTCSCHQFHFVCFLSLSFFWLTLLRFAFRTTQLLLFIFALTELIQCKRKRRILT